MNANLKPALSKDSLVSEILEWMHTRKLQGVPNEFFDAAVSRDVHHQLYRHLHLAPHSQYLAEKLQLHMPKAQYARVIAFAQDNGVSFLEAAMSLPIVTPEQYDEVGGDFAQLHRRDYAWMEHIKHALHDARMEDIRESRPPREQREALLSIPIIGRRLTKCVLISLYNSNRPLPE